MPMTLKDEGPKVRVLFTGAVTFAENNEFRNLLKELRRRELSSCLFDLSELEMIDSAGLGMFLIAKEQADASGWKLSVEGATGHVQDMLKLTKLLELINQ